MAEKKPFNVQDLYPEDYYFDSGAFYADPEGYKFTADDIAYFNAAELERYEAEVPMSPYEKRLLRKWVASGHSPAENPGSRYLCMSGSEPYDFLDVYRIDREIRHALKGKTPAGKEAYLKEYTGYVDPTPEEIERMAAVKSTPPYVQRRYEKLCRQIFQLWDFLSEKRLQNEAQEYLEDHKDDEYPVDFSFILD